MNVFKPVFDDNQNLSISVDSVDHIVITSIRVNDDNKLNGLTIKESGILGKTNGLILGIERDDIRILNPVSTTVFEWNDIIWIAGERYKIKNFCAKQNPIDMAG